MNKEIIIEIVNRVDDVDKAKKIILLYSNREEVLPLVANIIAKYPGNEKILDLLTNKNFIENSTLDQKKQLIKLLEDCNFDEDVYAIIKNYNHTFEYIYTKAKITYCYHHDKDLDEILKLGEMFSGIVFHDFARFKHFIETFKTLNYDADYPILTIITELKSYFSDFDELKSLELIEKIILSKKAFFIKQIVANYKKQCQSYKKYDVYNYDTISNAINWFLNNEVPYYYLAFSNIILQGVSLKGSCRQSTGVNQK